MTTNYEKIKNMTLDEMAEHFSKIDEAIYAGAKIGLAKSGIDLTGYSKTRSVESFKQWLQQESEG